MKIIKKSDKLTLKKMMEIQHAEDQNLQPDSVNSSALIVDEQPAAILFPREPDYIPFLDNPPVQSVGNSGWQISDIWRDIRVDDFCG
ncbi:hypothetical protein [Nostoc sp. KVJ20]|uniref:hypothetical protein n=1 Tax=Nostoc sp. KVJ20 TaxID=457944 RepID=UPI0009FE64ED|nr:hypothetical protein [Nostoc sp. KVJ20]